MRKEINIDRQVVVYDETGPSDGLPVILMHGWGCNSSTVKSIADAINHKCHVYSIDLPGFGGSPEPSEIWGVGEYTELVEKFTNRLNLEKPALIGHSYGGRISILMASRTPVSKVVLVDAAGIKPKRKLKYYLKVYPFKCAKKFLPVLFGKKLGGSMINRYRSAMGSSDYNSSTPKMRAIMSKSVNQDLKYAMPSITAPTLLIWGEDDTATPLSDAKTMERLIPNAGLVSFPQAGHYSFLDNPGQFRAVMQSFLCK